MKYKWPVILICVVAIAAFLFWKREHKADVVATESAPPPLSVDVLTLTAERIPLRETLPARVTARRLAEIRPQVDGIIRERLFEEGSDVEKGQPLYQIDDSQYKAVLAVAEADLNGAIATLKSIEARSGRYEGLVALKAVSKQEYDDVMAHVDQAKAAIAVAQARVDLAQLSVDYTKVYAPISGRIGKSMVTEGSLVSANQSESLAVITQMDPVYVDMRQSGAKTLLVRSKLAEQTQVPVQVILEETAGMPAMYEGVLESSDVTVDETTGSIGMRAVVPNPDRTLLPGMFVHVVLDLGEQDVVLLPQRATIRNADGGLTVWVVGDNHVVHPRTVTVSGAHGDTWIAKEGIKAGETIVMAGYQKIAPGATVIPEPWKASAPVAEGANEHVQGG